MATRRWKTSTSATNASWRTTAMIARYRDGALTRTDAPGAVDLARLREDVAARLDAWDLSGGLEAIWSVVRDLNRYVERSTPWQLAKDETRRSEEHTSELQSRGHLVCRLLLEKKK